MNELIKQIENENFISLHKDYMISIYLEKGNKTLLEMYYEEENFVFCLQDFINECNKISIDFNDYLENLILKPNYEDSLLTIISKSNNIDLKIIIDQI